MLGYLQVPVKHLAIVKIFSADKKSSAMRARAPPEVTILALDLGEHLSSFALQCAIGSL